MLHRAAAALLALAAFGGAAHAALSAGDYQGQRKRIQQEYSDARARCKADDGHAADICRAEAKLRYDVGRADLQRQHKPGPAADEKLRMTRAEAEFRVAKARCGDMKGKARDLCVKEAKAIRAAAEGQARIARADAGKGVNSRAALAARQDAANAQTDAQYDAERERCNTLAGDAKDNCAKDVKKKFGKI